MSRSRSRRARLGLRLGLWALWTGVLVLGSGCGTREATYVEFRARYECDFLELCHPQRFEPTCQPCQNDEQCPYGACVVARGRCRGPSGWVDETGKRNASCSTDEADACGGLVCMTRFPSREDCLDYQYGRDVTKREQMCTYDEDYGRECLRLLKSRSCADPRPSICNHVYDVCEAEEE